MAVTAAVSDCPEPQLFCETSERWPEPGWREWPGRECAVLMDRLGREPWPDTLHLSRHTLLQHGAP